MITGLDLNQTVDYVLKDDKENPTIWKLGVLPSYLFARVAEDSQTKQIETLYKILQISIKGWENFNIPYSTVKETLYGREVNIIPLSTLETLPMNIISELAVKVMEINKLNQEESKN